MRKILKVKIILILLLLNLKSYSERANHTSYTNYNLDEAVDKRRHAFISPITDSVSLFKRVKHKINSLHEKNKHTALIKVVDSLLLMYKDTWLTNEKFEYLAEFYTYKGEAYYHVGNYKQAVETFKRGLKYAPQLDKELILKIYLKVGSSYLKNSEFDSAFFYYNKLINTNDHSLTYASYLDQIGVVHAKKGFHHKADSIFRQSLKIKLDSLSKDHSALGFSYNALGLINKYKGNFKLATDYLIKAINIKKKEYGEEHQYTSDSYNNLGLVCIDAGYQNLALEYLNNALRIRKIVYGNRHPEVAAIYNNLGLVYIEIAEFQKAVEYFQISLDIKQEILGELHQSTAHSIHNLGIAYNELNKLDSALIFANRALNIRLSLFNEMSIDIYDSYNILGQIKKKKQEYKQALQFHFKSIDIIHNIHGEKHGDIADNFNAIASIYSKQNQKDKALIYYNKALKSNVIFYKNSLDISYSNLINVNFGLTTLISKSEVLTGEFKLTNNIKYLKQAIKNYDLVLKIANEHLSFMTNLQDQFDLTSQLITVYEELVELHLKLYSIEKKEINLQKAFLISEKSRATILNKTLQNLNAKKLTGIPDSLISEEYNLKSDINYYTSLIKKEKLQASSIKNTKKIINYENKLFNKKERHRQFQNSLENQFIEYRRLKHRSNILSVPQIQESLNRKTTIIEVFESKENYHIFLITNELFSVHSTSKLEIEKELILFHKHLGHSTNISPTVDFQQFIKTGHAIYKNLFFQPLSTLPAYIDEITVISSGKLSSIPIEIIPTNLKSLNSLNYKKVDYLINEYIINYEYSAASRFSEFRNTIVSVNQRNFIGYAPTYENNTSQFTIAKKDLRNSEQYLPPLNWNLQEVESIASLLEGHVIMDSLVTEGHFKLNLNEYKVLHLAMHTLVDDENPLNSQLVFSPSAVAEEEDGTLFLSELYNMKISAQLAVLSACNTGFGEISDGEGMLSLGYGFAFAGCPSLVASSWQVDDKSTSKLMQLFYANLKNGQAKNVALHNAKIDFLKEADPTTANPFYWGGFRLIGDTSTINFNENEEQFKWFIISSTLFFFALIFYILVGRKMNS